MKRVEGILIVACPFLAAITQAQTVTVSGKVFDKSAKETLPFVNVVLKAEVDSSFITGTVTNIDGQFTISDVAPNNYYLEVSYIGYITAQQPLYVGSLSSFLDVGTISLDVNSKELDEVVIEAKQDAVGGKWTRRPFRWRITSVRVVVLCCKACRICLV